MSAILKLYGGARDDKLCGDADITSGSVHGHDYLDGGEIHLFAIDVALFAAAMQQTRLGLRRARS